MLVELNAVEQRLKAVLEVLDGASVRDVARRYVVTRQSVHNWLRHHAADGSNDWSINRLGRCRARTRCRPRLKR
jgi:transposase-like protein